eukprot:7378239-Prymnesium_polylepis.1
MHCAMHPRQKTCRHPNACGKPSVPSVSMQTGHSLEDAADACSLVSAVRSMISPSEVRSMVVALRLLPLADMGSPSRLPRI